MSKNFWENLTSSTQSSSSSGEALPPQGTQQSTVPLPPQQPSAPSVPLPPRRPPMEELESAAAAAEEADALADIESICGECDDKWLVITITRHTKIEIGGRWDCTVGDLKMEIWDEENSGSGREVFTCETSERGGPADADFVYLDNEDQKRKYSLYNQYLIRPSNNYGISAHRSGRNHYYTYGYEKDFLKKPRPGIAIYGKESGKIDKRAGILIHAGTTHQWSVGCVVLHRNGKKATYNNKERYWFDKMVSVNCLLQFFNLIHQFIGVKQSPIGQKMQRVKLMIEENF